MTDAATWAKALSVVSVVFVLYLLLMWLVIVFWTYRDIASRTTDRMQRLAAMAVVALLSIPGLLVYLALRPPETSSDTLMRHLEAEALERDIARQQACPACGRGIAKDFVACPYCRSTVNATCLSCARGLQVVWVICPYCGTDRPEASSPDLARTPIGTEHVPTSPGLHPVGQKRAFLPTAKA